MIVTEVIDATDQEHPGLQRAGLARQRAGAASQTGQTLAKGGIKPFNESGVELAAALGGLQAGGHRLTIALHDAAFNGQTAGGVPLIICTI